MDKRIKPIDEVIAMLGEHLEQLRPGNAPTQTQINAAKVAAGVVDSYLEAVRTCIEYSHAVDTIPDLDFMNIGEATKQRRVSDRQPPQP
jgi:hypothetical protein